MLAISHAPMNRPRLLLPNELSMGLAPLMVAKTYATFQAVAGESVSPLLVVQNAHLTLQVSEWSLFRKQ